MLATAAAGLAAAVVPATTAQALTWKRRPVRMQNMNSGLCLTPFHLDGPDDSELQEPRRDGRGYQ